MGLRSVAGPGYGGSVTDSTETQPVQSEPTEAAKPKAKPRAKAKPAKAPAAPPTPPERTPEQIQSEIDAAQRRLADQVDELSDRLAPQSLAEDAMGGIKRVFVEADGSPKVKPLAIVAGTLTSLIVLRKIFHRS